MSAPRPRCRDPKCREKVLHPDLVDREDNTGLHYGCVDSGDVDLLATLEETSVGTEQRYASALRNSPPSTLNELHPVLIAYDASRPRSMQATLGPSELGTPCQQQIARKLAGAPQVPVLSPKWAPIQGTAMHREMELVLAFWNAQLGRQRWISEDDLAIDDEIHGHSDAYDLDFDCVDDWKLVGPSELKKLRAARRAQKPVGEQISPEYRVQVQLYGKGQARKGRPVKFVRVIFLARSWKFEESDEWTEPYQPEIADAALARYYGIKNMIEVLDVANNPDRITEIPATPSPDNCKFCPFSRPNQPSNWGGCAGTSGLKDPILTAISQAAGRTELEALWTKNEAAWTKAYTTAAANRIQQLATTK